MSTSGVDRAYTVVSRAATMRPNEPAAPQTGEPSAARGRARHALWLVPILLVSITATIAATLRTSTTFDEIVMMAGGARGFETGRWDLAPEHPPLTQYIYGLPIWLAGARYAPEAELTPGQRLPFGYRYAYAQQFFWLAGNDPARIASLGRVMAGLCAALLVTLTYAFAARHFGTVAGVASAALVAFLPDVLAHGGVAYNDIPLALAFLAAMWAADAAARQPGPARGAVFGVLFGLALGVKFSAVVIAPAALVILLAEAIGRGRDGVWLRQAGRAAVAALLAAYLTLTMTYRGDVTLAEFFYGLDYTFSHVNQGHGAPAYLLGHLSTEGWWYYYAVAFLYKTPAALHLLLLVGLFGFARGVRATARTALRSPLRMPVVGIVTFGAALVSSNLAIGFRYALPVLPLLCIVIAAGAARLWAAGRPLRFAVAALVLWHAASSLSFYPHFLAYTSEYGGGRDRGHELLLDSSLDWGQGLLEVRDWMRAENVDRIYLSYFGSALPAGYGIDYVPLASFFPLGAPGPAPEQKPGWAVVSATNLHGVYLPGDPLASLRAVEPSAVLGHTMLVYRIEEP